MDTSVFTEPLPVELRAVEHDAFVRAPRAQPMSRREGSQALRTLRTQRAFLAEYALCGVIADAAKAAGVDRRTVLRWQDDEAFAQLMTLAFEDAKDRILSAMIKRGIEGVDQPVYHQGKRVDTYKRYSDAMLLAVAKARMPQLFGAHGGQTNNVSVTSHTTNQLTVPIERLTEEEFALLRRIHGKAGPPILDVTPTKQISEFTNENGEDQR